MHMILSNWQKNALAVQRSSLLYATTRIKNFDDLFRVMYVEIIDYIYYIYIYIYIYIYTF